MVQTTGLGLIFMEKEIKFRIHADLKEPDVPQSSFRKYQMIFVGSYSLWDLIRYEVGMVWPSVIPGALGFWLRSKLYPRLFKKCGKGCVFGRNIAVRHPFKIEIGDQVVIDDDCMLDAKGGESSGIVIGHQVFIGRFSILSCKDGYISIGSRSNIGFHCEIFSGSKVVLEEDVLIAAYVYLIGGGHDLSADVVNYSAKGSHSKGIHVEKSVWIGAGAKIMDGVNLGKGSVIGAGAVVTSNTDMRGVYTGVPARLLKMLS